MATCYPPLTVDPTSIDLNIGGTGFSSSYITPDPSCEPAECVLPPLIDVDLNLPDQTLTTPQGGCKFTFQSVYATPPVFVPKPNIPNIPCPQGVDILSAITIVGSGSASVTGGLSVTGGPCDYLIGGIIDINVPPIPCQNGMSFSSNVTSQDGPTSLAVLGGPCNFALVGNIGPSGGGGNDRPGDCVSCNATCDDIETAIEDGYANSGETPEQGDIIDLCNYVYEVVGNPSPATTCPGSIKVVVFDVGGTDYTARQISTTCIGLHAYSGYDLSSDSGTAIGIIGGTHNDFGASNLGPISVSAQGLCYVTVDFTTDFYGNVTVQDNSISVAAVSTAYENPYYNGPPPVPYSTFTATSGLQGSGTVYQVLFSYDASSGDSVAIAQNVSGAQRFGVCAGSITGPWLV